MNRVVLACVTSFAAVALALFAPSAEAGVVTEVLETPGVV